jgi:SWI/SNF-related matrix-associated actin-dependent regulator of chromatin subfamily A-like protein 1
LKVVFTDHEFVCKCSFDNRFIPKSAGFRWDNNTKTWHTPSHGVAARLRPHCDESAKKEIDRILLQVEPWTGPLHHSKDEKLFPFQETAVRFALSRNRAYLGLDPGLGKTPVAATIASTLHKKSAIGVVYICPPFLVRNTEYELKKWAPELFVLKYKCHDLAQTLIVSDSILNREQTYFDIKKFVNYCRERKVPVVLFVDEAHRFKNETAGRTQVLFGEPRSKKKKGKPGIVGWFDRVYYLSGTPMPNRPIELYPVLSQSAPETIDFMTRFDYAKKYCAAHKGEFGWVYTGASNVPELAGKVIGKFMIRMKKDDVLKELPPKTEEMVLIGDDVTPKLTGMGEKILKSFSPEDLMAGQFSKKGEDLHISTYRKELGIYKAKEAGLYIEALLEDSEESILVFAIHKDVIAHLQLTLKKYNPIVITGDTDMKVRHEYVTEFQTNPARRVFIGNIQAAGTGLTLTKANRVVFAEFSWVPADNDQAADRAHRIGQRDNVFVQYLVFKNSIDRQVIETVLRKKKITSKFEGAST